MQSRKLTSCLISEQVNDQLARADLSSGSLSKDDVRNRRLVFVEFVSYLWRISQCCLIRQTGPLHVATRVLPGGYLSIMVHFKLYQKH